MRDYHMMYTSIIGLKKIIKASSYIAANLILDDALDTIIEVTCDCLNCERSTVFILDNDKRELWSKAASIIDPFKIRIPMG